MKIELSAKELQLLRVLLSVEMRRGSLFEEQDRLAKLLWKKFTCAKRGVLYVTQNDQARD